MATGDLPVAHAPVRARRRLPAVVLRWRRLVYHPVARGVAFLGLGLGMLVLGLLRAATVPPSAYAPVVLVAALYLQPYWMALVAGTFALELVMLTAVTSLLRGASIASWVALVANLLVIGLAWGASAARARVGVEGHRGESMFVDLRDRLRALGELPTLPGGWHAEAAVESAYGQSFSGDFVVATMKNQDELEVVLVDVSGKGVQAGTRSLLLSGALGGLLGETSPERFLGAANDYLLQREWEEGFATAVHVSLDLRTGAYDVGTAGHPAAVQFHAGSARWSVLTGTSGPVLGVVEGPHFQRITGRLGRGDALVLYTDGVVESRSRDLSAGVDRMLGAAERLVTTGFEGGARRLTASAREGESDDRAVVVVWRD